jgi:hypothetical protein
MQTYVERTMQPLRDDSRATLKIGFDLSGDRADIAQNFAIVSDIYNKLYTWDLMVLRAELDSIEGTHARQTPRRVLSEYAAEVPQANRLRLTESQVAPLTYVAVTGAQKPLLTLQRYLAHRHVNWDREAKEPSEDRRLELEEQRIDAVRERFDSLRGMGFPEIQIREALSEYVFGPLDRLARETNIKLFSGDQATASPS